MIKVGKPIGIHHTSMALKLMDDETKAPLRKVKVTITNGTKTIVKYSTKREWIHVHSLESGNRTIIIEFNTYDTVIKTKVGVFENNIARLEIKIKKTPPQKPTPPPAE